MVDPETGSEQLDQLEDERAVRHHRDRAQGHRRPTRTARSSRSSRSTPTSTRQRVRPLPEDADLRRQRPAAHLARRPARRTWPATSSAAATRSSQKITGRVDRPLQRIREFRNRPNPGIVVIGGPADHRRRHPRPGVHRLPAAGEVPHPLRADARPRHPQGREVPGQVALHRLRLLRRHAARVLPERHRRSPPSRRRSRRARIAEIIEDIWENRDRDYNIRCLVKRLQRIDKEMAGEARADFAAFVPDGDLARFARGLPSASRRTSCQRWRCCATGLPGTARGLQASVAFLYVAHDVKDEVESEWVVREGQFQLSIREILQAPAAPFRSRRAAGDSA